MWEREMIHETPMKFECWISNDKAKGEPDFADPGPGPANGQKLGHSRLPNFDTVSNARVISALG